MHIQRLHIPHFRVLRSVNLQFEHDFFPRIFPLGSQNGGGKSTLLQLMFTLLYCCVEEERLPFLQNLLEGYQVEEESGQQLLAEIEVWDEEESQSVTIRFFGCDNNLFWDGLEVPQTVSKVLGEFNVPMLSEIYFSGRKYHSEMEKEKEIFSLKEKIEKDREDLSEWSEKEFEMERQRIEDHKRKYDPIFFPPPAPGKEKFHITERKKQLNEKERKLEKLEESQKISELLAIKIREYIESKNILPVTSFGHDDNFLLYCTIDRFNSEQVKSFLKKLSAKIFLAAPMTQVFLFLSKEQRRTLFNKYLSYNLAIEDAKKKLPHFFGYDFLAVNTVVDFFKRARDLDFKQAIETGTYGTHYHDFMSNINALLANKKISLNPDLSGVSFKLDEEDIELEAEDLSHGELKRLSIYAWLKGQDIKNAIVLMDEIEIAFHPDWQYQIIRDLQDWAPENQYILATHSFDVCEALTPAHVKELEPKLQKRDAL